MGPHTTMEFQRKAFFAEVEEPDVPGFLIIESSEDGATGSLGGVDGPAYRVIEKWERRDDPAKWMDYWIGEEWLLDRIEAGKCKKIKEVSDKEFAGLLDLAGVGVQDADLLEA